MLRGFGLFGLAIGAIATLAVLPAEAASSTTPHKKKVVAAQRLSVAEGRSVARAGGPGGRLAYAPRGLRGHGTGYTELVGDPGSGLGFYALPIGVRVGAWRYHVRNERPPWQNPVRFAIAADAARYNYWLPVANNGYRYGVFNPNDGVGTPFFAGYYGPAGGYDAEPTLFGRPYGK
ncbi:hypothetical protein [Methylocella silvestris]|nr:hypothetical protein [Methylocella silvestris]